MVIGERGNLGNVLRKAEKLSATKYEHSHKSTGCELQQLLADKSIHICGIGYHICGTHKNLDFDNDSNDRQTDKQTDICVSTVPTRD